MKHLLFTLTIPKPPSWNGKWSLAHEKHTRARTFLDNEYYQLPLNIIGTHYYRWNDGWTAQIDVTVTNSDRKKERHLKNSAGFCGYDWMIDSLLKCGEIKSQYD